MTALIQKRVRTSRSFSSWSSIEIRPRRSCAPERIPSASVRSEPSMPGGAGDSVSLAQARLFAAAAHEQADEQADAGRQRDRLVRVGADRLVVLFPAGDDPFLRGRIEFGETLLRGLEAFAQRATGLPVACALGGIRGIQELLCLGHEGADIGDERFGCLLMCGCGSTVFHSDIF